MLNGAIARNVWSTPEFDLGPDNGPSGRVDSFRSTGGGLFTEGAWSSPCPCCGQPHANFDSTDFGPLAFLNGDDRGGAGGSAKPSLTIGGAGTQLTRSGLSWSSTLGTAATVTYAFRSNAPSAMPSDTAGFSQFTSTQISAVLLALQSWSDVANITFTRVQDASGYSDSATMLFGNYSSGQSGAAAFAYQPGSTSSISVSGDVWINSSIAINTTPAPLNYGQHTLTHEIGHALGLSHPANYNASAGGSITYGNDATYYEDSRQYTVMSYFGESNTGGNFRPSGGSSQYSAVPLLDDIAAAQRLYGANTTTRTGDTVYGFNSNADRDWFIATSATTSLIFAVWDAGGTDTFDFSGYTQAQTIDLRQGGFSSVGGLVGNVAIAAGAVIENAIGGSGNDTIRGNSANNRLSGNGGTDTIDGGLGTDTVVFTGARSAYSITWNGQTGLIVGNGQNVTVTNVEFLQFTDQTIAAAPTGGLNVSGDLTNETITGTALADTIAGGGGNDTINGLDGNDSLNGGIGDDTVSGGNGDDTLIGGLGNDSLDGGAGVDLASYVSATSAVIVNLATGTASGGAGTDTLTGIENVSGSAYNDTLTGDGGNNVFRGGSGVDSIYGGGGNDSFYSGSGGESGGAPDIIKNQTTANSSQATAVSLDGGFDVMTRTDVSDSSGTPHATVTATGSGNLEWYSFTAASGSSITIDIDNASFDSVVRILDSAGNVLAENDDGTAGTGDGGNQTDSALTFVTPANGIYYVQVSKWVSGSTTLVVDPVPAGGTYTLHVSVTGHSIVPVINTGSSLFGEAGDDSFYQGYTTDTANTGSGNDTIDGGTGTDTAFYNAASTAYTITTTNGVTTVTSNDGSTGVDTLTNVEQLQFTDRVIVLSAPPTTVNGTASSETLQGTGGDDTMFGLGGDDILYGYDGNDRLIGGSGNDTMVGGRGNDVYEVTEAGDTITELVGEGNDTVFSYLDSYTMADNVETLALVGSARAGIGNAGSNALIGNAGANTLVGGGGNDTMIGGAGDDTYEVTEAGDAVVENAGEGTDTVYSYIDNYVLGANIERLELFGQARTGSTSSAGGTIVGNALDNTLIVGGGSAVLNGGTGSDTAVIGAARAGFTITTSSGTTTVVGGGRTITLTSVERIQFSDQVVVLTPGQTLTGTSAGEVLNGGDGYDSLNGGGGDDTLYGYGGNDVLIGGSGLDTMVGGDGDDVYEVTEAGDVVVENAGEGGDTVFSYLDSYTLSANVETLALVGAARVGVGNSGNNTLIGTTGNNTLLGGAGNDLLVGGAGNDVYEVTEAGDNVVENAGEGTDTVFSYLDSYTMSANVETLALVGAARVGIGNSGINTLIGSSGDNTLIGGAGNDTMIGGAGNDVYEVTEAGDVIIENAGEGGDTVFSYVDAYILSANIETLALAGTSRVGLGNAGNNTLIGNAGNNVLNGNAGDDVLVGGAGADTFWHLGTTAGNDRITDFQTASEVIVLDASVYANFAAVQARAVQVGADVVITLNASTSLTLSNVQRGQLTAANFSFYGAAAVSPEGSVGKAEVPLVMPHSTEKAEVPLVMPHSTGKAEVPLVMSHEDDAFISLPEASRHPSPEHQPVPELETSIFGLVATPLVDPLLPIVDILGPDHALSFHWQSLHGSAWS